MRSHQRTIWKFNVDLDDLTKVEVKGAQVLKWLHAIPGTHMGSVTVWAMVVLRENYSETATFHCVGTGHPITEGLPLPTDHFATVIDEGLVWHLFQGAN